MSVNIEELTPEQQARLLADLQAKQQLTELARMEGLLGLFEDVVTAAEAFKSAVEAGYPEVTRNSNINPDLYTQYAGAVNIITNEWARKNREAQTPIDNPAI